MIFDLENDFESQNLSLFDKAAKLCKAVEDTYNRRERSIL